MRLFLIAAAMLSGAALLPAVPRQPPTPTPLPMVQGDGWNSVALRRDARGHYRVSAQVDGLPIEFVVDTGASDVVLSPADAARLGFRPGQLRFTGRASTANGTVALAPVTLREVRIGQLSRRGVAAVVNGADMPVSLLGMSFLSSLERWEAQGDRLMLYW
ncbi:MAG: TIGR02281 family clan AA aspartic protease [Geminicoccaceae bacterium]